MQTLSITHPGEGTTEDIKGNSFLLKGEAPEGTKLERAKIKVGAKNPVALKINPVNEKGQELSSDDLTIGKSQKWYRRALLDDLELSQQQDFKVTVTLFFRLGEANDQLQETEHQFYLKPEGKSTGGTGSGNERPPIGIEIIVPEKLILIFRNMPWPMVLVLMLLVFAVVLGWVWINREKLPIPRLPLTPSPTPSSTDPKTTYYSGSKAPITKLKVLDGDKLEQIHRECPFGQPDSYVLNFTSSLTDFETGKLTFDTCNRDEKERRYVASGRLIEGKKGTFQAIFLDSNNNRENTPEQVTFIFKFQGQCPEPNGCDVLARPDTKGN
jgi:hypothetical protein